MIKNTNDTVVLFFSRSGKEEVRHKHLTNRERIDRKLFGKLIDGTHDVIKASNLPYIVLHENQQIGENFGERFTNAIKYAFDKGFQNVITVGNDCPTLSSADLIKADEQLKEGNAIVGPAKDGGVYLIGISKSLFKPQEFNNLNWQTPELFVELNEYFAQFKSERVQLQVKGDIDDQEELYHFLSNQNQSELAESIKKILLGPSPKISDRNIDPIYISQFERTLGLRGPPLH